MSYEIKLIKLQHVVFTVFLIKQKEVADRKQVVKIMDLQRRKNEKLNDLEEEERVKAEVLLKKANEMRLEQEDEIKYLNEVRKYHYDNHTVLLKLLKAARTIDTYSFVHLFIPDISIVPL